VIGLYLFDAAFAAQVALRLGADELREGQTVALDLTVVDAVPRGVPEIAVPAGMSVVFDSQSRERQIINFQPTSSTKIRYSLSALAPGDYVLPPIKVETDAGTLTTAPFKLRVEPRASGGAAESMTAELGADTAWVGQVLVYDLRFQTDKKVVNGRWSPPAPPGFTTEPSVEPVTAEFALEQDGKPLSVMELHYPLRASAPGKWTVPAGVLQAQFAVTDTRKRRRPDSFIDGIGPFGNVRTEVYSSPPLDIEVRDLPAEGRPADGSALVGRFTVTARASQTAARVGDTVTIEVVVEGDGPLAGYALPPLAGDGFRVYDDQPVVEARLEDGAYRARATYKRAIVPQAPGSLEIPPIDLAFFDPAAAAWTRARTEPVVLDVSGEAAAADVSSFADPQGPRSVDALGEDILPVRTDAELGAPLPRGLAALLVAPGALLLAAQAGRALSRRRRTEVAERPLQFSELPSDPEQRLAALERIFRERVSARLRVAADALRREDLAGLGAAAEEAEALYRALERCRYGDARTVPEDRIRTFVEGLR
jgi:hypothetical protein